MTSKKVAVLALVCAMVVGVGSASADPILDSGWAYDEICCALTDSDESPYALALVTAAYLRITDYFVTGDTYFVYDFGALILTTSLDGAHASLLPIGDPSGDAGWTDASFEHGEVLLAAGLHDITIQGDGEGGLPAGFYTRLDSAEPAIPEPGTLVLLGSGMLALVALRRRRLS
jgi:hypothetical protein